MTVSHTDLAWTENNNNIDVAVTLGHSTPPHLFASSSFLRSSSSSVLTSDGRLLLLPPTGPFSFSWWMSMSVAQLAPVWPAMSSSMFSVNVTVD